MMQPEQRGTIYIASPYAQWIIIIILGMYVACFLEYESQVEY